MKRAKKITAFLLACLLTASAAIPALYAQTPAEAARGSAETAGSVAARRQEDLAFLYETLKEYHPNLFTKTSEADFNAKYREIEGKLDGLSDFDFILELQSLISLIGDSHTSAYIGSALSQDASFYPVAIGWFDGQWVITSAEKSQEASLGKTITAVNGLPIGEFEGKYACLLSADNPVKLRRQFAQVFYVEEIMAWLGLTEIGQEISLSLTDSEGNQEELKLAAASGRELSEMEIVSLASRRAAKAPTDYDRTRYYKSLPLDKATYYIQYNACQEDEELSMESFTAQVRTDLEKGSYSQVILDLRYNGGGSDGVLRPLLNFLTWERPDLKLFCLIDEATFSSAIINSVMIAEAGGILVGSPTSGSVDHFGSVGSFTLPNSGLRVGFSKKYIDLGSYFEAAQKYGENSLLPDYQRGLTLADYLAGRDTAVDFVLKSGPELMAPVPAADAVLTRGRFVGMLGQLAEKLNGSPIADLTPTFADGWDFAWYYPYLNWAAGRGIVSGTGSLMFEPARAITRQEMAAMLGSYLVSRNYLLPLRDQAVPGDASAISGWAAGSVERVLALGLMSLDGKGNFNPNGRVRVAEAAEIIAALD